MNRLGVSHDTFRLRFGPLKPESKQSIDFIKLKADELLVLIEAGYASCKAHGAPADPRCFATAQTHLEAAVMFAVKGLTE